MRIWFLRRFLTKSQKNRRSGGAGTILALLLVLLHSAFPFLASAAVIYELSPPQARANFLAWGVEMCTDIVEGTIISLPDSVGTARLHVDYGYIGAFAYGDTIDLEVGPVVADLMERYECEVSDTVITFVAHCDGGRVVDLDNSLWYFAKGDSALISNPRGRLVDLGASRDSLEALVSEHVAIDLMSEAKLVIDGSVGARNGYHAGLGDNRNHGGVWIRVARILYSSGPGLQVGDSVEVVVPSTSEFMGNGAVPQLVEDQEYRLLLAPNGSGKYSFAAGLRSAWVVQGTVAEIRKRVPPCPSWNTVVREVSAATVGGE